jgi:hypothetical protein
MIENRPVSEKTLNATIMNKIACIKYWNAKYLNEGADQVEHRGETLLLNCNGSNSRSVM